MGYIIRIILIILAVIGMSDFIFPITWGILNAGNLFGILLFSTIILISAFFPTIKGWYKNKIVKWIVRVGGLLTVLMFIVFGVFSVLMIKGMNPQIEKPQTVIVLGAGVREDKPTQMLRGRLDAAANYLNDNPNATCIVSGGLGAGEIMTEAMVMKNYLLSRNINGDRIIMEEGSTTTGENLAFSKEILDEMGLDTTNIAIATNGFHQYRAGMVAKKNGFQGVYPINSSTNQRLVSTFWVREWFGIGKYFLFGDM